jgi:hypothetical protein
MPRATARTTTSLNELCKLVARVSGVERTRHALPFGIDAVNRHRTGTPPQIFAKALNSLRKFAVCRGPDRRRSGPWQGA